jgi:hypothetical protein
MRKILLVAVPLALVTAFSLLVSGCGGKEAQSGRSELSPYTAEDAHLAVRAIFPKYVTAEVRDGYEYALARPDVLKYLPCYCGCGLTEGHTSNLDCFIRGVEADGTVRFDEHGSFCDICLQIARDARRLLGEGKTLAQVRAFIDRVHSEKGPGTDTPWPPQ